MIYSIAETAKANNLKSYEYFEHLLTRDSGTHGRHRPQLFGRAAPPGHQRCRKTFENKIYSRPRKWFKLVKVLAMDRLLSEPIWQDIVATVSPLFHIPEIPDKILLF